MGEVFGDDKHSTVTVTSENAAGHSEVVWLPGLQYEGARCGWESDRLHYAEGDPNMGGGR